VPQRELKGESYGVELLHAVGFVYSAKAKQFLAANQSFLGVGGWLHNVQGKYHVFSETYVNPSIFAMTFSLINASQSIHSALGN
jgi:X-domain of DnaJ-containing